MSTRWHRKLQTANTADKEDYVSRWLAQTAREEDMSPQITTTHKDDTDNGLRSEFQPFFYRKEIENSGAVSLENRQNRSPSESTFLEAGFDEIQVSTHQALGYLGSIENRTSLHPDSKRKIPISQRSVSLSNTASLEHPSKREMFVKRKRHMTREDCYDLEEHKHGLSKVEPKRSHKRQKGNRKSIPTKACEHLLENFSSRYIKQERLTTRPAHGPGLFKNGRASSRFQRRGLPDLAFSEMGFLRHSRHQSGESSDEIFIPKSRQKEKRKRDRDQNEISAFFSSKMVPSQEANSRDCQIRTQVNRGDYHKMEMKSLKPQDYSDRRLSRNSDPKLQSLDSSKGLFLSNDCRTTNFERRGRRHLAAQDSRVSNTLSGDAPTICSWSDSIPPPSANFDSFDNSRQVRRTTTPASVRRSLENSGVFAGTGICLGPYETAAASFNPPGSEGNWSTSRWERNSTRGSQLQESPKSERYPRNHDLRRDSGTLTVFSTEPTVEKKEEMSKFPHPERIDAHSEPHMQQKIARKADPQSPSGFKQADRLSMRQPLTEKAYVKYLSALNRNGDRSPEIIQSVEPSDVQCAAQGAAALVYDQDHKSPATTTPNENKQILNQRLPASDQRDMVEEGSCKVASLLTDPLNISMKEISRTETQEDGNRENQINENSAPVADSQHAAYSSKEHLKRSNEIYVHEEQNEASQQKPTSKLAPQGLPFRSLTCAKDLISPIFHRAGSTLIPAQHLYEHHVGSYQIQEFESLESTEMPLGVLKDRYEDDRQDSYLPGNIDERYDPYLFECGETTPTDLAKLEASFIEEYDNSQLADDARGYSAQQSLCPWFGTGSPSPNMQMSDQRQNIDRYSSWHGKYMNLPHYPEQIVCRSSPHFLEPRGAIQPESEYGFSNTLKFWWPHRQY